MNPFQKITLRPFSAENLHGDCRIDIHISRGGACLNAVFELTARLNELIIPGFDPSGAQRRDRLWEHTCFEIFLGHNNSPEYQEFNFSPSGDWNVYTFSGYRTGMKQETAFETLPFEVQMKGDRTLILAVNIDLKLLPDSSNINAGLSAVLEHRNGVKSYWAVSHTGERPDFHAREGWIRFED